MKADQFADRNVQDSSKVVDAALRAFWRGSAGAIDRLAGGPVGDEPILGELLLLLLRAASASSAGAGRTARRKTRAYP